MVTYDEYQMMKLNGEWHGGWVMLLDYNVAYITTFDNVEQDNEIGRLGSYGNPFSETAYNEMMAAHTWPGGHVQYVNDVIYRLSYILQMSSSGSCSGSVLEPVSGCGACYVRPGVEDVITTQSGKITVRLTWGPGYTQQIPFSYLHVFVLLKPPYQEVTNTLTAEWDEGYNVRFNGTFEYRNTNGNNSIQVFSIGGNPLYEIPEMYRGHD